MKNNYRIDFIAKTAAHLTTFPQTEQSQAILNKNRNMLADGARKAGEMISSEARSRFEQTLPANRINIYV